MAQPTICLVDDIFSGIITAINAMETDNYFYDYSCVALDESVDYNTQDEETFICELYPQQEETLSQGGQTFTNHLGLEVHVNCLSTRDNYKTVLSKVDQDFKRLLGNSQLKIVCPVTEVILTGSERFVLANNETASMLKVKWTIVYSQDVKDPQIGA